MIQDKILKVDLSTGKIVCELLPDDLRSGFIGGRGINMKLLFDGIKPLTDAYSPENLLIFCAGALVGTGAPATGRANVTAKSPLTVLGDANGGGNWSPELRFAGYSHIMIRGRADKPVYLRIYDDYVQLKDAKELWGLETWETEQRLKDDFEKDPEVKVACIGPAGENLVRFACVKFSHRTAARCGLGAVMGSKRLKAIAVRATKRRLEIANPKAFAEATKEALERIDSTGLKETFGGAKGGTYGTVWSVHNNASMMLTRHMQTGYWEDACNVDPELFFKNYKIKRMGCFSCPIRETPYYEVQDEKYKGVWTKVEYGQIAPFSAYVDVRDLGTALKGVQLADRLGMDTKSCGCTISFAMELFERGIINERDIGFPLRWGDGQAVLKLTEMIAKRQGFGNILAEGEYRAARIIGKGAENYDITVKRMEPHEPLRAQVGNALAQYVSSRGPDHLRGSCHIERDNTPSEAKRFFGYENLANNLSYEHKATAVVFYEQLSALADMLGVCKIFTQWLTLYGLDPEIMAKLVSAATGLNVSGKDLYKAGERVVNVERAFIVREGIRRKDDYPPKRELEEPFPNGPYKGAKLDKEKYDHMLDEYYLLRGWNVETGIPTENKLSELGLNDVASNLKANKIL